MNKLPPETQKVQDAWLLVELYPQNKNAWYAWAQSWIIAWKYITAKGQNIENKSSKNLILNTYCILPPW